MLLWIVFAVLTAAALLAVIFPLGRRGERRVADRSSLSVYRDQLRAVDADIDKGLLDAGEADAARAEISRRLLAAADARDENGRHGAAPRDRARAAIALSSLVVAIALGGYLTLGSPNLPGQPAAERAAPQLEQQQLASLVAQVEAHLQRNPRDGKGWDVIAPAYMRLREFGKAASAFRQAIDLLGPSAARHGSYGEALAMASGGLVTQQARQAFATARELDPSLVRPRFFLAIAHEQDGDWPAAEAAWRELIATSPPQAPYRPVLERKLAEAKAQTGTPQPGPSAEDMRRAQELSEDERRAMIGQMVADLAARLERDGDDVEGWLRLIRSYTVLGRRDEARTAARNARTALRTDAAALARIDALATELGIAE